jgi:hypothetical protein
LYDLNDKKLVKQGNVRGEKQFAFDQTEKDYFLLIVP